MTRSLILRTALGIVGLFVVTGCGLTGCSSGSSSSTYTQSVRGDDGTKSSVSVGAATKLPADFPTSEVPLPPGKLLAAVTGEVPPNHLYNLTFNTVGKSGRAIANRYQDELAKAGYKIENASSVGGSDGGFTTFNAIGKHWDLDVLGGKANIGDKNPLSVQVVTHGTLNDLSQDNTDSSSTTTTTVVANQGG